MISLYTEIIEFLEDHLKSVKDNKHYPKGNGKAAAHYALANAIGHIKALKGLRDHTKKKKRKNHNP